MHDFLFSLLHAQRLADLHAEASHARLVRMVRSGRSHPGARRRRSTGSAGPPLS